MIMKYIDKFLSKLKTDRNTFVTYVLTLISVYICIDRIAEILFMIFSGLSVSYWGPIKYTLALACPVFAFYFSFASKFADDKYTKTCFFYVYAVALYIVSVSMFVQWMNQLGWLLLFSVPNYSYIIANFMDLIKPAFSALAWYLPIVTFFPLFKWLYTVVDDTLYIKESIWDYGGIDLSDKSIGLGPYTCEMFLCKDRETGKNIKTPESRRFESTLIVGVSGSGKTSMMFEPMIARDIEKKYFFRESAKELGYTALRTNIATLNCPYSNDYINENFSLNMISPVPSKEKVYKAFFAKLLYYYDGDNSIYKNLGITYMAPDYESISHIKDVANNFGIKYNIIDPNDNTSIGLNPFSYQDPIKTSIAISSILKRLYASEDSYNLSNHDEAFMENVVTQAIENLVLLLKEVYPRLHEGDLPNLEDLLDLLNDFDLIEQMSEQMKEFPELAEKYKIQLGYFKKTFYKTAHGREETEKFLQASAAQLENMLRYPGVRNILCNRVNNLNYDNALANGDVTLVCTRRGDLGPSIHKAFGLFFILLMQQSVLSRPGNEKTRIPHFLYIDEFPPFVCKATEDIFTLYRKYRVGTIISSQNLSQFGKNGGNNFRQTLLANCSTKVVFGNNTPEDNEWWEKEFGDKRRWMFTHDYKTDQGKYDDTYKSIKWQWIPNYKAGKVQALKFKFIIYKTKDLKGKNLVGQAKIDFLESRYKEKQKIKNYNFSKFTSGIATNTDNEDHYKSKPKFDLKNINFSSNPNNPNDMDPIQTNTSDASYKFDNEDAITSFNSNKNNE
ncbi:MAG TPA: TraM recognition domain-containing protein [Candidatus Scatovivens faecipullorum]|nr:TraM recognition domain-containing protein [Candidatus Scatovivens faecipullorum]